MRLKIIPQYFIYLLRERSVFLLGNLFHFIINIFFNVNGIRPFGHSEHLQKILYQILLTCNIFETIIKY